jgi:hypothetical protein
MKTPQLSQRQMVIAVLFTLFFSLLSSNVGAQTSQDGPSFPDTAKYITTFLASHGCTSYMWNKSRSANVCASITTFESCQIELTVKQTVEAIGIFPQINSTTTTKVDLSSLDPTSIKTGRWKPDFIDENEAGFAVVAQLQAGGIGLSLPVDNADNAAHLINALSHAITLCGGKKAAF